MRLVIDLQGAQGVNRARGIGRYSRELARAMAHEPREHDLAVALNGAMLDTAETLADEYRTVLGPGQVHTWFPPSDRPSAVIARAQFLASLAPDLVHVSSVFEGLGDDVGVATWPVGLERLTMAATCYDLIPFIRHKTYFAPGGVLAAHQAQYYACLHELSLMDGLLAISASSRHEAIGHLALDSTMVFDVGVGMGPAFHPAGLAPAQQDELRRRHGLWGAFILFVGAGDARKNEAALVEAFGLLPRVLQATHQLMIVGPVNERPLRAALAFAGCDQDRLVLVPAVSEQDLVALYSECALFVYPSLHEGFGLPAAEAMACGATVLVSNASGLPDIVGRADATFDPTSAEDIALCMTRVLRSTTLRRDLPVQGRERVAAMTWAAAAGRAWDALEAIYDRMPGPAAGVGKRRRSLAFVSPLPPQETGIADYSRTLLPALSRHYDVTLVSERGTTDDPLLAAAFPHLDMAGFLASGAGFDRVLYQLGCSDFHDFQFRVLLPAHPGVAVLHDASLAHLWNLQAHRAGRPDDFLGHLHRSHGYQALLFEHARGRDAAIARYPCCGEVLEHAVWTIEHSRYAVGLSFAGADRARSRVIPQVAHLRPRPDRTAARHALGIAADEFVLCSFGLVSAPKQPVMLLEAWRAMRGTRGRLAFVGAPSYGAESLNAPAEQMPCLTGRVDRDTYDMWFAAADLAVQLRRPSQGETSAAITDCLCFGVPLIVNDHGAAHELPDDCAVKLPDDFGATELRDAIESLRDDPARRDQMAQAAQAFAARHLRPATVAALYAAAIEQAYATPPTGRLAPGPKRLLIDVSELARHDGKSGIQRVVREVAARLLVQNDLPWPVEVVRFKDGGLHFATEAGTRLLGTRPFGGTERLVEPRPGDVLLCLDLNALMTPADFLDLRRRRLAGTRIVLVVYDLLPMQRPDFFTADIVRVSAWYRRALSIADQAICISRAVADELAAWLDDHPQVRATRLPIDWFHLAGNFRDDDDSPADPAVTGALACAVLRPTLLMTGTLEPRKGYGQTLAAFEALWAVGKDVGLVIVGRQGWHTEALAKRLREHERAGAELHWLPGIPDVQLRQLYRAASGLLMASEAEGFGLPLVEAARAGLPILARDLPVFREIVGEHATFFNGHAPDDLTHALAAWFEARQQGGLPSSHAIATLDWDGSATQLLSRLTDDAPYRVWSPPGLSH